MIKNILLVDDMTMNRKIIRIILSKAIPDVNIIEAEDGFKALEIIEKGGISVVILDIMMPGKDGIEVLKEVKSKEKYAHIPVLMCSALNEVEHIERALSLGALDYFTKPLTEEQMRITLPLKVKNALEYYEQKQQLVQFYDHVKEEIQLAEQLQKSLIFEKAEFEKAKMWGRYLPSEGIGGDMFCCREIKNKLWFIMADISGHGISAAMVSTMMNVIFNTSIELYQTPSEVLQNINKTLFQIFGGSKYGLCSAFVGCVEDNLLSYANAGHPYPVFYKKEKELISELHINGFLLGMLETVQYETEAMEVYEGDAIILYTDGIFDKGTEGGFAKWTLVHDFCQINKAGFLEDLSQFIDIMVKFFAKHGEQKFIDDVAIMAIQIKK